LVPFGIVGSIPTLSETKFYNNNFYAL